MQFVGAPGPVQLVPQVVTLLKFVSQPFAALPSQLPKPLLQDVIPHAPLEHDTVAAWVSVVQFTRLPQSVPQVVVAFRFVSQPLVRLSVSQSAKPELHVPVHAPPEHARVMLLVEHAMPQAPHAVAVVFVSVSQPSVWRFALQFARPAAQVPLHALDPQVREAMPVALHTVLQAPQLFGSRVVSTQVALAPLPQVVSDPQDTWHVPPEQNCPAAQAFPQAPQFALLLVMFTSQPSAAVPLQFAKPALQLEMPQVLAEQLAVAFGTEHTMLQPPQFVALLVVFVSQPLLRLPSQLPRPVLHVMPQRPAVQVAVPPVLVHARPQTPQFDTFVVRVTSQPLVDTPSQSAVPVAQLTIDVLHVDAVHTSTLPMGGVGHDIAHDPQCVVSPLTVFTSQPSTALPLQFAKPVVHAPRVQRLETQLAPACANWQVLPHAPQFVALLVVFVSQPLAALPSQSAKPLLHAASTHAPARQPATPFGNEHTCPQADMPAVEPQLFGSFCTSRQVPEQLT